uniref:Uncharacterized protein n=1 Tax=Candidatus Kentrum sp. LFY TaxID=2126342 RepID=A0A450UPA8_9GAMM|nr:MAG: hypothetical protein BECKLFY1418B_GA0070995_105714 [Candidatus Kentron sp. LFY]
MVSISEIPDWFTQTTREIADIIKADDHHRATDMLEELSSQTRGYLSVTAVSDEMKMEMLGNIALRYRDLGDTEQEVLFLEDVYQLAQRDLRQSGIMALPDDIYKTAVDLLLLGVGYIKLNRKKEAKTKIDEAKRLFTEIEWDIDVQGILADKHVVYIGPDGGREPALEQLPDSPNLPKNTKRPCLLSYNFEDGGKCFIYYPSDSDPLSGAG